MGFVVTLGMADVGGPQHTVHGEKNFYTVIGNSLTSS